MLVTDLAAETLEKIGSFLDLPPNAYGIGPPPVNKMQGDFDQVTALRRNAVAKFATAPRTFKSAVAMMNPATLPSGRALFYAMSRNAPERHVQEICARCPEAISTVNTHGSSVLPEAVARKYSLGVIRVLCGDLAHWTAKKLAVDQYTMTPMHVALMAGANDDVVEFLMDPERQVIMITNNNNDLPLHCALQKVASLRVIPSLIDAERTLLVSVNKQENTPLHIAAEFGISELGVMDLLLYPEIHSHIVQLRNDVGLTPLYVAVENKRDISMIEMLIDAEKKVLYANTTLHRALAHGASPALVRLLIDPDQQILTNKTWDSHFIEPLWTSRGSSSTMLGCA